MAYYMNKSVPAKRGDIFYISNSKCYATDPSNTAGILCSLGIAAPMVDGEPVDNSVTVERNLYKHLYEDLLNKVMAR